jgi:hypothetical protein
MRKLGARILLFRSVSFEDICEDDLTSNIKYVQYARIKKMKKDLYCVENDVLLLQY